MTILIALNLALLSGISVLLLRLARRVKRQQDADERLAQLREAVTILTDATESGFAALATRLSFLANTPQAAGRPRRAPTCRAKRSEHASAAEIAAREGVSEGEVHLRLSLAEAARRGKRTSKPGVARRPPAESEPRHA